MCRFVIFEEAGSDMIGAIEAALIKLHRPLWNSLLDGFGNHDPGSGRYNQAKSDWDVMHEGRVWADRCKGVPHQKSDLLNQIRTYLDTLRTSI
ncbi:MAG: Eco29kI family restriction endonuclease [Azoarcus sp.]|nr:Eco29kI family restriction endonuclease [Azoarcus sp.]